MQMLPFSNPESPIVPLTRDTPDQSDSQTNPPAPPLQLNDNDAQSTPILRSTRARPIIQKRDPNMFYY